MSWLRWIAGIGDATLVSRKKPRDPLDQLAAILRHQATDLVLDVGANRGQYARMLREHGYRGRIRSFEPLPEPHAELSRAASADPLWEVEARLALGDVDGKVTIERSLESDMSSVLPQSTLLREISPSSAITERLEVEARRLDTLGLGSLNRGHLKIDVQGFEPQVLDGATGILDRLASVQLEMALLPVYKGEIAWREIVDRLDHLGYDLHLVIPGYFERKLARQLQIDGVFVRRQSGIARQERVESI